MSGKEQLIKSIVSELEYALDNRAIKPRVHGVTTSFDELQKWFEESMQ